MVDGCGWWVGRSAGVACWLVWFAGWLVCITHQRANQPTEHTNKQLNQPTNHQASQPAQSNQANHTTQPSHTPTPTNHKHERTRPELRARSQCRETDRDLGATWAWRGVPPAPSQRNATQTTTATQTVCSKTVELQKRARHPRFSGSVSVPQKCNKNASSACVTRVFGDCD